MKNNLKEMAIELRRQGLSYREIMQQVPVAKSTISEWLHSVHLAQHQKQRLTEKKLAGMKKGAQAHHEKRMKLREESIALGKEDIGVITYRELWLIGTMLYWAEGSKEKEYSKSSQFDFINSDPEMIRIFLCWLSYICKKDLDDIVFDIYIHETHRHRQDEIVQFWAYKIGIDESQIDHIYYKKGNPKTKRKNIGNTYHGILRVGVKKSSSLLRMVAGWTQGVIESIR